MLPLADLRKEYSRNTLDEATVNKHPIVQFEHWFKEALGAKIPEPSAMTLSTVTGQGLPSARIVLLKGIEANAFVFYTNLQSAKGKQLDDHPACALTFFWPELERQVRIEGMASRTTEDTATAYFQGRPRESQVSAWASPQSAAVASRKILEDRVKEIEKRFEGKTVLPKPKQWGGYRVEPHAIEFWQGRPNRLHDRILYTKSDEQWTISRLAP
jgi:pyridoxamine 5'-phosphate oxidase